MGISTDKFFWSSRGRNVKLFPGGSLATRRGHGPRSKTKQVTTRRYRPTDSHVDVVLETRERRRLCAFLRSLWIHLEYYWFPRVLFGSRIIYLLTPHLRIVHAPAVWLWLDRPDPVLLFSAWIAVAPPLVFSRIPFRVWIGRLASLSMLPASLKKRSSSRSRRPARQDKKWYDVETMQRDRNPGIGYSFQCSLGKPRSSSSSTPLRSRRAGAAVSFSVSPLPPRPASPWLGTRNPLRTPPTVYANITRFDRCFSLAVCRWTGCSLRCSSDPSIHSHQSPHDLIIRAQQSGLLAWLICDVF
jgi:hypothetical protein